MQTSWRYWGEQAVPRGNLLAQSAKSPHALRGIPDFDDLPEKVATGVEETRLQKSQVHVRQVVHAEEEVPNLVHDRQELELALPVERSNVIVDWKGERRQIVEVAEIVEVRAVNWVDHREILDVFLFL